MFNWVAQSDARTRFHVFMFKQQISKSHTQSTKALLVKLCEGVCDRLQSVLVKAHKLNTESGLSPSEQITDIGININVGGCHFSHVLSVCSNCLSVTLYRHKWFILHMYRDASVASALCMHRLIIGMFQDHQSLTNQICQLCGRSEIIRNQSVAPRVFTVGGLWVC